MARHTEKDERDWKEGGRKANHTLEREHEHREEERKPRARGGEAEDRKDEAGKGGDWYGDAPPAVSYSGKSHVTDEAEGEVRKKGGKVEEARKKLAARRKKGGKVEPKKEHKKEEMRVEGKHVGRRLDRPGRKRGGGVGSDISPLSSAARIDDRDPPNSQFMEDGDAGGRSKEMQGRGETEAHFKSGGRTPEHWMGTAVKHPGALHRELHVPEGKDIPEKKLEKAAHSSNEKLARRAKLAETFDKYRP